jgi:biopolymer transport protein ExbD
MSARPGRRRGRYRTISDDGEINLTPLLDIIFNLLFFFVVATTIRTEDSYFELVLPESSEAPALERAEPLVELLVASDGALIFRGERWEDRNALIEALGYARQEGTSSRALLSSDGSARVQDNISAMDALQKAGFEDVIQRVKSEQ